ncbi:MAG TPA: D-galactarate dehydratase [Dehalococcoidia bacterium]|nr:D-galactarate dehydratase [Dehalococcoidia bacterium]
MEKKIGLKVNPKDNVATLFANDIEIGDEVVIQDKAGHTEMISSLSMIPYGHKIAVYDLNIGDPIIKYGENIGIATAAIKKGEHVHVHNLDSARGRGDL